MTHRKQRQHRGLLALLLALTLVLAACGGNDGEAVEDDAAADTGDDAEVVDEELDNELLGLEVRAAGNVTEVVDGNAFRIDKDGLGSAEGADVDAGMNIDVSEEDGDLDYFNDYEENTLYDDDFTTADVLSQGALVINVSGSEVALDDAVRVDGTIRRFAETTLETVYRVELDDGLYDDFEDHLVIVADTVETVQAAQGASESAAPSDAASPAAAATPSER